MLAGTANDPRRDIDGARPHPNASPKPRLCGPFLRFQNITLDTNEWTGSVLVVLRSSDPAKQGLSPSHATTPAAAPVAAAPASLDSAPPKVFPASEGAAPPGGSALTGNLPVWGSALNGSSGGSPGGWTPQPGAPVQLVLNSGGGEQQQQPQHRQQAQHVSPFLLDSSNGWDFWRFDLRLPLSSEAQRVHYSVHLAGGAGASASGAGNGGVAPLAGAAAPGLQQQYPPPQFDQQQPYPPVVHSPGGAAAADGLGSAADGKGVPGAALWGSYTFWLPGIGQPMHSGYYSCSGISADVSPDAPERKDPCYLWKDLLNVHSAFPLHVLIGGGDQVYSDPIWKEAPLKAWTSDKSRKRRLAAPWTAEMAQAAEAFYVNNYLDGFCQKEVAAAMASIPQVMSWDDHDIWDGWGSYPPRLQNCPVFQGLFVVAKRFYLLFQHHTTHAFNQHSGELFGDGEYHFLKMLGPQVALLGIDMRTRRQRKQIIPQDTYPLLSKVMAGLPPSTEHLLVMSGVPLVFPQVPVMETLLGALQSGMSGHRTLRTLVAKGGLSDQFGNPGILDDMVDGWAAKVHKEEKLQFVRLLQEPALRRGIRVSVLSGDAHVCGVGRLYSHPKMDSLSEDPLYMTQVISSAIMNAPPPRAVNHMLHRTNFATNLDERTREKMVRLFKEHHPRFHKLLRKRNWCDISVIMPPYAPPLSPLDPLYRGIRFSLRCENATNRIGHAEEVYDVTVPRLITDRQKGVPVAEPAAAVTLNTA